jgi:hypothetical protein
MNNAGVNKFARNTGMTIDVKGKIRGLINNAGISAKLAKAAANAAAANAAAKAAANKAALNSRAPALATAGAELKQANAARGAAMKTMANKAAANAKAAEEKAAVNKAANNAALKAVANKAAAIEKALAELAKADTPTKAEYAYGIIKTQLAKPGILPVKTEQSLKAGRAAAMQMIKEYSLQQFIKEFYKKTTGTGTGATWRPNEKNKTKVNNALATAISRSSLANSNRSALKKYYNLTNDFKVTYEDFKAALNKAGLTDTNRKLFINNISRKKFGASNRGGNAIAARGRITRYFASP